MNYKKYLSSISVSLEEVLAARDSRSIVQKKLIAEYKIPLVVFTLNIAGPIKVFDLTIQSFYEGVALIKEKLSVNNLNIYKEFIYEKSCGYEAYFSVDCDAYKIKKVLLEIEEDITLGRLFDIDVLNIDGDKISRSEFNKKIRKCFICDSSAFECSRSRKHSLDDILQKEIEIMVDYFTNKYSTQLSKIALKALLFEINTTPKPGLVDLNNNGAHSDLDVFLFQKSAISLESFFKKFVSFGIAHSDEELTTLLSQLRVLGKRAEYNMLQTTNGVNTHKGAIFIFSLVLCSLGWLYANNIKYSREKLMNSIKELANSILNDFFKLDMKKSLTHGERIYLDYNVLGIRGEAKNGFDLVFKSFLPCLNQKLEKYSFNDSGVYVLLKIIESIDDTNIISRSDFKTMQNYKEQIHQTLQNNSIDSLSFSTYLDQDFIRKGISAGGSADLLALTYFLYFYESEVLSNFEIIKS